MSPAEKYLNHFAEKSCHAKVLSECKNASFEFEQVVCVPACAESDHFPDFLKSLNKAVQVSQKKTLLIVCLNNRVNAESAIREDNEIGRAHV